ncbi:hypothetical protein C900_05427 [Fulvivirga imtechensis AK7]|uniref:Uncharacterized protein n=1 Tax=Fulvivirga imtechensis AK7 TaxID=1237149 RepID=L8JP33_9BACT|nr:tetratricopeptide repeat protein [Fulvivirga imtechensis]ELR69147.1 hypothetical protein C900_05427 [Fulvivirga imtechensis AK7]
MDERDYQQIESYLQKELEGEELARFEARMAADPEFAATVETYLAINSHLQARVDRKEGEENLKRTIGHVSAGHFNETNQKGKVISLKSRVYWAAAASLLLLISFVYILNLQSTPTYEEYAHYEPLTLSSRSENEQLLTQSAEAAFNSGQYTKASQHLEELLASNPDHINIKLYLALSLIEIGEYTRAEVHLKAIEQGNSIYAPTANWYLALSYLKQGDKRACIAALKNIPPESSKYKEAQELLKKLSR